MIKKHEQPYQGFRTFLKAGTIDDITTGILVMGIPLDSNTSFRSGARHAPAAIREASLMLTDGSHPVFRNDINYDQLRDLGDFPVNNANPELSLADIFDYFYSYSRKGVKNLIFGGDHSITFPMLRAHTLLTNEKVSLVHFDAHCDTWDNHWGSKLGHGTWLYHAIENGYVDPETTVQIGIRSPAQVAAHDYLTNKGGLVINNRNFLVHSLDTIVSMVKNRIGNNPVYLTFDIDALDPAYAPGTGTPEIGGLTTLQAQYLLENLDLNWVGADFVEVAPAYDHSNITSLAAATLAYTWVCQQQSTFKLLK